MAIAAILHRRTVREYDQDYVIPREHLEQIVDAALRSPTARGAQDVDLLCVTNKALISEIGREIYSTWPPELQAAFDARKPKFGVSEPATCDPNCLMVLIKNERTVPKFIAVNVGIVAMSVCIAAQEFGLESMTLGGIFAWGRPEGCETILKIPKGSLAMAVAIGKPREHVQLDGKHLLAKATYID
jgi:nitroreductase